tara:strand:+ start:497 stop:811 length:315 start_codon:yes stop_codon:yes gene_type:complete
MIETDKMKAKAKPTVNSAATIFDVARYCCIEGEDNYMVDKAIKHLNEHYLRATETRILEWINELEEECKVNPPCGEDTTIYLENTPLSDEEIMFNEAHYERHNH